MGEDNMYKLAPSILNADYSNLGSQIRLADKAGADMIHLDVCTMYFIWMGFNQKSKRLYGKEI